MTPDLFFDSKLLKEIGLYLNVEDIWFGNKCVAKYRICGTRISYSYKLMLLIQKSFKHMNSEQSLKFNWN